MTNTTTEQTIPTNQMATKPMTQASAINAALYERMAADDKMVILGEDVAEPIGGVFKTHKGLSTEFGTHRVRSTPIAEGAIAGTAVGLALGGYRPLIEIMFFDFMTLTLDQVLNHAAKFRYMTGGATPTPMTVTTVVGSSTYGAQHAQSLEAWFMHTPGINVVMPSTPADAKGLLTTCLQSPDPNLFIQHLGLLYSTRDEVPEGHYEIPFGVANTLRAGRDLTIITYGSQVPVALEAADQLAQENIEAEVIDLRTLVPLDFDTVLASVERTRRAVVVHEATQFAGPGAEIAARIQEDLFGELLAPVLRVGGDFTPVPFSAGLNSFPTVERLKTKIHQFFH